MIYAGPILFQHLNQLFILTCKILPRSIRKEEEEEDLKTIHCQRKLERMDAKMRAEAGEKRKMRRLSDLRDARNC